LALVDLNLTPSFGSHHPDDFAALADQAANMGLLHPHLPGFTASRRWQRLGHTSTATFVATTAAACDLLIDETLSCVKVAHDIFNAGDNGITVACFLGVLIHLDVCV